MVALCMGCPDLLSLRLPECHYISNMAVNAIAYHCKKLQELVLTDNNNITDQSMCALFSSCTDLRHVNLDRLVLLTSAGVLTLLRNCPSLQSLSLNWEYSLINDLIAASANESEAAEIIGSKGITDETLEHIPICCKELKILRLYYCNFISRTGVWTLIGRCKSLVELEVRYCKLAKPTRRCWAKCKAIGKRYRGLKIKWDWVG